MRFVTPILIIILVASLIANGVMYAKWRSHRPIFTVNSTSVSKYDMDSYLAQNFAPEYKTLMARRILIHDEAVKHKLSPSQVEINEAFEEQKEHDWRFANRMRTNPWIADETKNAIRQSIEQSRLLVKDIQVTPQEIEEEYKTYTLRHDTPSKAKVELGIVLNETRLDQVVELLKKGVKPGAIMENMRREVVFIGNEDVFTFFQPFNTKENSQIFSMKPGEVKKLPVTPDLAMQGGKAIVVKMIEIIPGKKADLNDPKTQEKLRLAIAGRSAKPLNELLSKLWSEAKIESEDPKDKQTIENLLFPDRMKR